MQGLVFKGTSVLFFAVATPVCILESYKYEKLWEFGKSDCDPKPLHKCCRCAGATRLYLSVADLQCCVSVRWIAECFGYTCICMWASQGALVVENLPASAGDIGDAGSIPE